MTQPRHPLFGPPGHGWFPGDQPPEGQRAALQRLAAALRETIELLMDTEAPEDQLNDAAANVEEFNARLAAFPRGRALWGYAETSNAGDSRAFFESSPLIGLANPIAPPLRLTGKGREVEGTAVFGTAYEGPPGHVHGGFVAAAFDEALGMVQSLGGQAGMTGTLTLRYRRPTPLHVELRFHAQIDRIEGRKTFASGTLTANGELCAEAEGVFVAVDFERMRRMAEGR